MDPHSRSPFAQLREAYQSSQRVRTAKDLAAVLERIARVISEQLGWGTVVLNIHRRAWDDFHVTVVHGSAEAERTLLGTTQTWEQWAPLLADRFEVRGAHLVPAAEQIQPEMVVYEPPPSTGDGPGAWNSDDMLLVMMRGADGEVAGILSVDQPVDGRRPGDEAIDALVVAASTAGAAIQQAHEAAADAQHRAALEHLLRVSAGLADARSPGEVLDAVCRGIRDALGFERVAIELADPDGGLAPAAQAGWAVAPAVPVSMEHFAAIFLPEYEEHGCYVIERDQALRILDLPDSPYASQRNGRGPWAWNRHWLCVPLREPSGRLTGFIWADEPEDRLLPDTERLQALRLFADQAQSALEAARHYELAVHMAEHDALTGLPNRAVMLERLRHALLRSRRTRRSVAVLFIDIDRFKTINDTHGHEAGDEVLRTLSSRIDEGLRPGDTLARLGGDEFVVLCEDVVDEDDALDVARRIRARLAEPVPIAAGSVQVTASVGVAMPSAPEDDAQALLHYADVAMYRAKQSGRDGEAVASASMRENATARARLERALRGALDRGEMRLCFQPIVATASEQLVRAEALMRWEHPELGPVSPLEFIPLAEDNGSIVELGRWAMAEACAQWAGWRARHGARAPGVAVNLSPRQLKDAGLHTHVAALIERYDIPRGGLTVEITESALLEASPSIVRSLTRLRAMGCAIELDDFGTGYSSLSSLADFQVDGIKIDRRFVSGPERDGRAGAIAEAVLAMAGALGLRTTAEGVETREQLAWLRALGCPEAQGYLLGRPGDAAAIDRVLAGGEARVRPAEAGRPVVSR